MNVGTLVRKTSNGNIGVIVKKCHGSPKTNEWWVEVLYYSENIFGCWTTELEVV